MTLNLGEIASLAYELTVKVTDTRTGYNGSGVIFKREDNVYSIFSNKHVVAADSSYEIQTDDGSNYLVKSQYDIPGLDLVVLQFESEVAYQSVSMGNSDDITPLQTIYVSGFPSSQANLDLTSGEVRTIDRSVLENPESKQGYALLYSNQTLPRSSGGSVLNEDGLLIAINGQAQRDMISGRDLSRGIPINLFKSASLYFAALEPEIESEPEPESDSGNIMAQAFAQYNNTYFLAYNPIGHDQEVTSIAISNNGQLIASGSDDQTINIWDARTGQLLRTLEGHQKRVNSVAIAADGRTIVSGSGDETIRI